MRILQIGSGDLLPGGAQKVAWRLHNQYIARGHRACMSVGFKTSNNPAVFQINTNRFNLWLERWWAPRVEKHLGWQYFMYPSSFFIARQPYFKQADVVHFHNTHWGYFTHLALPLLTACKPTIWTLHDMWAFTGHCAHAFDCERWRTGCDVCPYLGTYPPMRLDTTAFLWRVKRKVYTHSRLTIVAPSNWLKSRVEDSILARFECLVIPNGIDVQVFSPAHHSVARQELGIPREVRVITFTVPYEGDEYKGFDFLVNALRLLSMGNCLLRVTGKGELPPDLQEKYIVKKTGWIGDEHKLGRVLSAADVFIQPSLADTAPSAVIEAMACGTPVVGSNVGGIPEMIRDPQAGLVVPANDSVALARAICVILENDELRQQMSHQAREIAVREYGLDMQVDRYLRLYERVIGERKHDD